MIQASRPDPELPNHGKGLLWAESPEHRKMVVLTEADQESSPCGCSPGVGVEGVVIRVNEAVKLGLLQGVSSLVLPACMAL